MQEPLPIEIREMLYAEEQTRQSAIEVGEQVRQRGSRQVVVPQRPLESC